MPRPERRTTDEMPPWVRNSPDCIYAWTADPDWRELAQSNPSDETRALLKRRANRLNAAHIREKMAAHPSVAIEPAEMTLAEAASVLGVTSAALRVAVHRGEGRLITRVEQTARGPIHWVTPAEVDRYRREHLGQRGRHRKTARPSDG